MNLKIAFQMDSLSHIKLDFNDSDFDSTLSLAFEAQDRGYSLYHYTPSALCLEDGQVRARANKLILRRENDNYYTLGEDEIIDLKIDVDLVFLRQDPPFDMAYITSTHILDHLAGKTTVLNNPAEVRNAPEKLLVTHFSDLTPPTLITSDRESLLDFHRKYGNIILKPLYNCAGEQVYHIDENSFNLNVILEMFEKFYREPIIAQKYIPEARKGDKRIYLFDGEPAGAYLRVPPNNDARSLNGPKERTIITERDREICDRIGPELKKRGLVFVGIDVIGEYLTEINVTSPGGLQRVNALYGVCLESLLWDAIEERFFNEKKRT